MFDVRGEKSGTRLIFACMHVLQYFRMHKKVSYQSGKLAKRRRKLFIFRIILGVIFVVTLVGGTAYWSHADAFNVHAVAVEGTVFAPKDEIVALVEDHLVGSYWFWYARANFALLPRVAIARAIREAYPAVQSVDLDLRGMNALLIRIKEYEPVARWCADTRETDCYFVEEHGRLFSKEPLMNSYELIALHGLLSGEPIGQTYVSADFVRDMVRFDELLAELELSVVRITTEDGESFTLETEEGLELYVDKSDRISEVYNNLVTVVRQEAISKVQFRNIEYIDLRFGNKVVYKLKEW